MRSPTATVLAFFSLVVGGAFLLLAGHLGESLTRSPAEVEADAGRLAELVRRTRLEAPGLPAPAQVTYTFRHRPPEPGGRDPGTGDPARLHRRALGRRPAAQPAADSPAGAHPDPPRSRLRPGAAGTPPAALPQAAHLGRRRTGSLAPLARPGGGELPAEDFRVLALLARLVRARICPPRPPGGPCLDTAVTLYRDERPARYRLEVRALGEDLGMAAFLLAIRRGPGRILADGDLLYLPRRSSLALPVTLSLLPPRPTGEAPSAADPGAVELAVVPGPTPTAPVAARVDLQRLLGDTAW
jgi:hypothetical protein